MPRFRPHLPLPLPQRRPAKVLYRFLQSPRVRRGRQTQARPLLRVSGYHSCQVCVKSAHSRHLQARKVQARRHVAPRARIAVGCSFSSTFAGEACAGDLLASTWQGTALEHMHVGVAMKHRFTKDGFLYHACNNAGGMHLIDGESATWTALPLLHPSVKPQG